MDYTGYDMRMRMTPENCFILQIIRKTDPTIALVFITIKFRYNAHTDWLKSVPSESIKHEAKAVAPSVCFQIVMLITNRVFLSHNLAGFI